MYMPGRSKLSCEYRYTRSLSEKLRHGRWTEAEDILLLEAINKYGPRNWVKISNCVRGRSALQCRDRWIYVLDHKRRDQPWTWEEYMRLFYGVRLFGRDECAKIAKLLPGRNNMDVRMRIRFLVKLHIESNIGDKPVIFRHFANNYRFFKTRRKTILDQFSKYLETKQNDKKASMVARLGLGSFVAEPSVGVNVDYTSIRNMRIKEFNNWSVMGSGRWMKVKYKNPNERDRDDLLQELEQLPDDQRDEALSWLEESDVKLEAEFEQEKQVPEYAVDFYDKMFTNERINELQTLINELLPARDSDNLYYIKHQKRPPKLGVIRRKKSRRTEVRASVSEIIASIDKIDNNQFDCLKWSDKLLVDLNKEMGKLSTEERRVYLVTKLCEVLRLRLHYATLRRFKTEKNLTQITFNQMLEYVKQTMSMEYLQSICNEPPSIELPIFDSCSTTFALPPNWKSMTMKELLQLTSKRKISPEILYTLAEHVKKEQSDVQSIRPIQTEQSLEFTRSNVISIKRKIKTHMMNLIPPSVATISCMDVYNKRIREQLQRDLSSYSANNLGPDMPGTSTQIPHFELDKAFGWSDIKDEVRSSPEYALLKMRMFRLFFYPLAMVKSIGTIYY